MSASGEKQKKRANARTADSVAIAEDECEGLAGIAVAARALDGLLRLGQPSHIVKLHFLADLRPYVSLAGAQHLPAVSLARHATATPRRTHAPFS